MLSIATSAALATHSAVERRADSSAAMASFHGVAGQMRSLLESDEFDLGSLSSAASVTQLITDAFAAPREDRLSAMVRVTLVVGAGKANRQKYDAALQKWVVAALNAVGYADDKSACCDFASAGSFKTQHDTGRNLFFVHVFPRCERAVDADESETVADESGPAELSREHVLCAAEVATFQRIVKKKAGSWSEKKRLMADLRELRGRFVAMDAKLMHREALTDDEDALYGVGSTDDLEAKCTWLLEATKQMLDDGALTAPEKVRALGQMDARLDALAADGSPTALEQRAVVEANRKKLDDRACAGAGPKLEHDAALRALHKQLAPLAALEQKAKGGYLSVREAAKLGEKDDLEARVARLEQACRGWYETDEELDARLAPLRKHLRDLRQKAGAAKPKPANAGGWSTAPAKSRGGPSRTAAKKAGGRSLGGFGALAD